MRYSMEELLPVIKTLTEKYTGKESTSVTYEKAQQLMGAILYCIGEQEKYAGRQENGPEAADKSMASAEKTDPQTAYTAGRKLVMEKVYRAKALYEDIIDRFDAYGSECLYDTVAEGIFGFFVRYDPLFFPQEDILTLDYPILDRRCDALHGVDRIHCFLQAIMTEQQFLFSFPRTFVVEALKERCGNYKGLIINVGAAVMHSAVEHMWGEESGKKEYVRKLGKKDLETALERMLERLTKKAFPAQDLPGNEALAEAVFRYLRSDIPDFATELKNRAENGSRTG